MENISNTVGSTAVLPARPQNITHGPRSLSREMASTASSMGSKRYGSVAMSTIIKAPVEDCFNLVAKQFKEAPRWDPTVKWVVPTSSDYIREGSKSRFIFDLDGSIEEADVVVRSLVLNESIVWTSNHHSKLQEEWRFGRESDGTVVMVTLSYNSSKGIMKYLTRQVRKHCRIEQKVSEMLRRLKLAAELPKPRYL